MAFLYHSGLYKMVSKICRMFYPDNTNGLSFIDSGFNQANTVYVRKCILLPFIIQD